MTMRYVFVFICNLVYLGIFSLFLKQFLEIDTKIIYMGIIGFSAVNYAIIIRLTKAELKNIEDFIKNKKVTIIAAILNWFDFTVAIITGSFLYTISSAALVIPLVWLSVECYLVDKGLWYLTPMGILIRLLLYLKVDLKNYALVGPSVVMLFFGKVQKSLR